MNAASTGPSVSPARRLEQLDLATVQAVHDLRDALLALQALKRESYRTDAVTFTYRQMLTKKLARARDAHVNARTALEAILGDP
jgi:uncharacterized membrane protein